MFKYFLATIVVSLALVAPAMGQAPAAPVAPAPVAPAPVPVALKPEAYAELGKLMEQLAEAKEDEEAAATAYQFRQAMRIVIEQAIEAARLRGLMGVGVTDPTATIAEPPKPEGAKP